MRSALIGAMLLAGCGDGASEWPKHVATFREADPAFVPPQLDNVIDGGPLVDDAGNPVRDSGHWTPEFTVEDDWELRWESRTAPKRLELRDANGDFLGRPAGVWPKGTSGVRAMEHGGTFRVVIGTDGPWKVEVWQNSGRIE